MQLSVGVASKPGLGDEQAGEIIAGFVSGMSLKPLELVLCARLTHKIFSMTKIW